MKRRLSAAAVGAVVAMSAAVPLAAQEITVALGSEPTALDPHFHDLGPNNAMGEHMFESLVGLDASIQPYPELATGWELRDPNTWVFTLRQGVRFTNGDPFTADDVLFTICRIMNNETSLVDSFTDPIRNMTAVETPDDYTVVITTEQPNPFMLVDMADMMLISDSLVEHDGLTFDPDNGCGVTGPWPTVDQFNDGSAAVGTGPYTVADYVKGANITLARNDGYWGGTPSWERVTFVPVQSEGPRLAGLIAGDYDLMENPAGRDLPRLDATDDFDYVITPSARVIFLQMDTYRSVADSPALEAEGDNPFMDVRVRRAISMAIDRQAIVERIMDGVATVAYQFLPDTMFGALPAPPPLAYDPDQARALLAEAGYPDGFKVTLATPNDRYINDERVAQAIAQFLNRIGIETDIDAMTRSIFFGERRNRSFSFSMAGWGSSTGEASSFLRAFVATTDRDLGVGLSNYGGYTNPDFDAVFLQAISTMDDAARKALLQESVRMALDQLPLIPIHFESTAWAFRAGLTYEGRADQSTLAMSIKPAP